VSAGDGIVSGVSEVQIVHPVPVAESEAWVAAMSTTFLEDGPAVAASNAEWRRRIWEPERHWGAYADGRWVATLATLPRGITVPGVDGQTNEIPADALSMVTVSATHRRRGLLRTLLSDSLHHARDRGDPVSILYAAEWPIYGRFGYSPAEQTARYTLLPRRRGGIVPPTGQGGLRQVDAAEMGRIAPAIFDTARRLRAGNINRPALLWERMLGLNGCTADLVAGRVPVNLVHDGPDGPDGYLTWSGTRDFDMEGRYGAVTIGDLIAVTPDAYRRLCEYLTGMDAVEEITLSRRPVDEPLRWLLPDGRALRQDYTGDGVWLRLLDVPAALSSRRYLCPGRLVLEVVDEDVGGYATGRYVLDGCPDGASCERADGGSPDLRLSQHALASAYLGGFSLRQRSLGSTVDELNPGALDRADAMFATPLAPWCATGF
jgi:predicted acetyltransferase